MMTKWKFMREMLARNQSKFDLLSKNYLRLVMVSLM